MQLLLRDSGASPMSRVGEYLQRDDCILEDMASFCIPSMMLVAWKVLVNLKEKEFLLFLRLLNSKEKIFSCITSCAA